MASIATLYAVVFATGDDFKIISFDNWRFLDTACTQHISAGRTDSIAARTMAKSKGTDFAFCELIRFEIRIVTRMRRPIITPAKINHLKRSEYWRERSQNESDGGSVRVVSDMRP